MYKSTEISFLAQFVASGLQELQQFDFARLFCMPPRNAGAASRGFMIIDTFCLAFTGSAKHPPTASR
jgi:hypothetical protein